MENEEKISFLDVLITLIAKQSAEFSGFICTRQENVVPLQ